MSNSYATNLERLKLLYDAWVTAYTASIAAISSGVRPSYSIDGQSVSWDAVYTNGPKVMDDLQKAIAKLSWQDGAVQEWRRP